MRALLKLSQGDMRRALNILQSCASAFDKVTADSVYATTGAPLPSDVEQIVTWLLNEPFATAFHRTPPESRWTASTQLSYQTRHYFGWHLGPAVHRGPTAQDNQGARAGRPLARDPPVRRAGRPLPSDIEPVPSAARG